MARRRALAGPLPRRVVRPGPADPPGPQGLRRPAGRLGQPGGLDHHGLRPPAAEPGAGPGHRPAAWCPSSPTRPGPSASSRSSARSRSTPPRASATCRSTPAWPSTTPRAPPARCSRRASPRPGPWPPSPPRPPPTPPGASPCSPSTSSTRCSASSGWATCSGPSATCRGRGFLLGCTAGRTTLNGEGLQHQDGHSLLLASTNPPPPPTTRPSPTRWPSSSRTASRRMPGPEPEDRFWYLTLYNENYPMPAPARGARRARPVRQGIVGASTASPAPAERAGGDAAGPPSSSRGRCGRRPWRPGGCWPSDWGVEPTSGRPPRTSRCARTPSRWSAGTGSTPADAARTPYVTERSGAAGGPGRGRHRLHAGRARPGGPVDARPFTSLGTDGFGRSDTREALRRYFEVDAAHVVVAVLPPWPVGPGPAGRGGRGHRRLRHRPRGRGALHALSARSDAGSLSRPRSPGAPGHQRSQGRPVDLARGRVGSAGRRTSRSGALKRASPGRRTTAGRRRGRRARSHHHRRHPLSHQRVGVADGGGLAHVGMGLEDPSTSPAETFSPPRMMTSSSRPTTCSHPSPSTAGEVPGAEPPAPGHPPRVVAGSA